ncbi:hypothetical protein BHE74_00039154 [Ensete ventricosum]|nr:hypothetical protein BHE74_00039154 [Ensete ventricosum]
MHRNHVASLALTISSGASGPISDGCAMVSWSFFVLLDIFVSTVSHFVLSYALTHHAYDVMV